MRLAYVGLSLALALFILAQAVNKPVFFYALIIPLIVFVYGMVAKEILPEVKRDEGEEKTDGIDDPFGFF